MKRFELKYYLMTPIFIFVIFALVFTQVTIFSLQKAEKEKLRSLEKARLQNVIASRKAIGTMVERQFEELPNELWNDYIPEGMPVEEFKEQFRQYWKDDATFIRRLDENLNQNIVSRESQQNEVASNIFTWQSLTKLDKKFMNSSQITFMKAPVDYFSEERWAEIKQEFGLSDYQGIWVFLGTSMFNPELDDINVEFGVMDHSSQVKALYNLELYEQHHLPVSRYSDNGLISGIFQRDLMYNVICLIISLTVSLIILLTLKQDKLDKMYYLSLGHKKYYRHRFSLLFFVAFIPLILIEGIVMLIRNIIEPGVRLDFPIMAVKLTEKLPYSSEFLLSQVDIGPMQFSLQKYQDFLLLDTYPLWLILLLNLVYFILLVAFVAVVSNYVYSILATKSVKWIALGGVILMAPIIALFILYPIESIRNLFDTTQLLIGRGPWPYGYTLIGLGAIVLFLYFVGEKIYQKAKIID